MDFSRYPAYRSCSIFVSMLVLGLLMYMTMQYGEAFLTQVFIAVFGALAIGLLFAVVKITKIVRETHKEASRLPALYPEGEERANCFF